MAGREQASKRYHCTNRLTHEENSPTTPPESVLLILWLPSQLRSRKTARLDGASLDAWSREEENVEDEVKAAYYRLKYGLEKELSSLTLGNALALAMKEVATSNPRGLRHGYRRRLLFLREPNDALTCRSYFSVDNGYKGRRDDLS